MAEYLEITLSRNGKVLGTLVADERTFSTGSKGYFAHGKVQDGQARLQVSANVVLIGSKPQGTQTVGRSKNRK